MIGLIRLTGNETQDEIIDYLHWMYPVSLCARASGGNVIMSQPMNAQCDDDVHDSAALALCAKMRWRGVLARGVLPDRNSRVYVFVAE